MTNQRNILVTGATGLIGREVMALLNKAGYAVRVLTTRKALAASREGYYYWQPLQGELDEKALAGCGAVIHLAGEPIAKRRWTAAQKKRIVDSRVTGLRLIGEALAASKQTLDVLVSASAVGWYGMVTRGEPLKEDQPPAKDFLAQTCVLWEQEADRLAALSQRVVKIRLGMVLSASGGALRKLLSGVRLGLAAMPGSGKQFVPWIHVQDAAAMFVYATRYPLQGSYNGVAPQIITMRQLLETAAAVLNKRIWIPAIPPVLLKWGMGEMADMVLTGSAVSSKKIEQTGFPFRFPGIKEALKDLLHP